MRKYLGSLLTAYAAVIAPLFVCGPVVFAISALCSQISVETVFLACGCIACALVWGLYIKKISNQLYSWGHFTNHDVRIITGVSRRSTIVYEKCKSCGIGFYTHGVLNSKVGTKIYFIFLSYDRFDESYRSNINLWLPSQSQIKVQFSQKLFNYLLAVLPPKQSQMLSRDYRKYLGEPGDSSLPRPTD